MRWATVFFLLLFMASSTASWWDDAPWKASRCVDMWTEHTPGTPLEGREVFTMPRDINPKAQSNHGHSRATLTVNPKQAALMLVNVTWPPSDRGTVKDFYRAVGQRKTTLPGFHPGARFGTMTAKADFVRRILLIKNLKAGSSTVGTLIDPERKADEFRTKHMNQTEMLLQCMDAPTSSLCVVPKWISVNTIPEILAETYFTFSFVRDPFTRVVSSHYEFGAQSFTEVVMGNKAKVSQNPHFLSQVRNRCK